MLIGGIEILPVSVFLSYFLFLNIFSIFGCRKLGIMLPETKELIQGINQKDEKAWKVLFKSFYAPLCHYSYRILADEQVVPDIVKNTLVNLWYSSVRFENGKALTVYLYRAVWNNALKYLRDRNVEEERLKHWFEEEGEMSEENFYSVVREELFRKLRELIDRLPEERKKIMLMSLEGKSGEEIACDLNITIHTVKQQKYRAYKFLREQLGQYTSLLFIFFFR